MLNPKQRVYITIEWQEYGPLDSPGRRLWWRERRICTIENYPQYLPCHNPDCEEGGFEIGEKINELLASTNNEAQNSLICFKAMRKERQKRCSHVITYSIVCILPYQHQRPLLARVI